MANPFASQVIADPSNMLAPMMAAKSQGGANPFAALLAMNQMGGMGANPLAAMALMQQGGPDGYPTATIDDGDPRRGMFSTGSSQAAPVGGQSDRDILAKTLMAEAGGEGPQGMLAAGAVIANRVKAGRYGNGLEGVIMRPGQFSAWNGVTGYAGGQGALNMANIRPSAEAYAAADAIISGSYSDPTGGATHYYNPSAANPNWGQRAGGNWQRIGNHVFGFGDGSPGRT